MTDTKALMQKSDALRNKTLGIAARMTSLCSEISLPQPPDALGFCAQRLQANHYLVMVMGETRRGKSTLINALIGQDLLPVDVDVTTSQVFHIQHAEKTAFRVRFEDDSARDITQEELRLYGSQVAADAGEALTTSNPLRWIEIETPVKFLPYNLALLDTPGIGSLYAAHKEIVQRFVPRADAVIYVLSSEAPMMEGNITILKSVLKQTRDIFFVQTKMDVKHRKEVEELRQRNEEILKERFGDQLTDSRVWLISGENLALASRTGDENFTTVSGYPEFRDALQTFLMRVAAVSRIAAAMTTVQSHYPVGRQTLKDRETALNEQSKQRRDELKAQADQHRQAFEMEWGPNGTQRREVISQVERIKSLGKAEFAKSFQAGSGIDKELRSEIEYVSSVDEAQDLADDLGDRVIGMAGDDWNDVTYRAQQQCAKLVSPFIDANYHLGALVPIESRGAEISVLATPITVSLGSMERFKQSRMDFMSGAAIGGAIGSLLGPLGALAGSVIGGMWAMRRGREEAARRQGIQARQQLIQHLSYTITQVRGYFFNVDQSSMRFSRVDEYFDALARATLETVKSVADRKMEEARAEVERLKKALELDEEERKQQRETLQTQVVAWEGMGSSLRSAITELQQLDEALQSSALR